MGVHVQNALQDYFDRVQEKAEGEMAAITLKDILNRYQESWNEQHPCPLKAKSLIGRQPRASARATG